MVAHGPPPVKPDHHGRTLNEVEKLSSLKGATRAFIAAAFTQPSADFPAAPPLTDTDLAEPSEPNTMPIRVTASMPSRQAFTPPRTAPIAPSTAPCEGLSCLAAGPAGPPEPSSSFLPSAPTRLRISSISSPTDPIGAGAVATTGAADTTGAAGAAALSVVLGRGPPSLNPGLLEASAPATESVLMSTTPGSADATGAAGAALAGAGAAVFTTGAADTSTLVAALAAGWGDERVAATPSPASASTPITPPTHSPEPLLSDSAGFAGFAAPLAGVASRVVDPRDEGGAAGSLARAESEARSILPESRPGGGEARALAEGRSPEAAAGSRGGGSGSEPGGGGKAAPESDPGGEEGRPSEGGGEEGRPSEGGGEEGRTGTRDSRSCVEGGGVLGREAPASLALAEISRKDRGFPSSDMSLFCHGWRAPSSQLRQAATPESS